MTPYRRRIVLGIFLKHFAYGLCQEENLRSESFLYEATPIPFNKGNLCYEKNARYLGGQTDFIKLELSSDLDLEECAELCLKHAECRFWSARIYPEVQGDRKKKENECRLYRNFLYVGPIPQQLDPGQFFSGPKICPATSCPITIENTGDDGSSYFEKVDNLLIRDCVPPSNHSIWEMIWFRTGKGFQMTFCHPMYITGVRLRNLNKNAHEAGTRRFHIEAVKDVLFKDVVTIVEGELSPLNSPCDEGHVDFNLAVPIVAHQLRFYVHSYYGQKGGLAFFEPKGTPSCYLLDHGTRWHNTYGAFTYCCSHAPKCRGRTTGAGKLHLGSCCERKERAPGPCYQRNISECFLNVKNNDGYVPVELDENNVLPLDPPVAWNQSAITIWPKAPSEIRRTPKTKIDIGEALSCFEQGVYYHTNRPLDFLNRTEDMSKIYDCKSACSESSECRFWSAHRFNQTDKYVCMLYRDIRIVSKVTVANDGIEVTSGPRHCPHVIFSSVCTPTLTNETIVAAPNLHPSNLYEDGCYPPADHGIWKMPPNQTTGKAFTYTFCSFALVRGFGIRNLNVIAHNAAVRDFRIVLHMKPIGNLTEFLVVKSTLRNVTSECGEIQDFLFKKPLLAEGFTFYVDSHYGETAGLSHIVPRGEVECAVKSQHGASYYGLFKYCCSKEPSCLFGSPARGIDHQPIGKCCQKEHSYPGPCFRTRKSAIDCFDGVKDDPKYTYEEDKLNNGLVESWPEYKEPEVLIGGSYAETTTTTTVPSTTMLFSTTTSTKASTARTTTVTVTPMPLQTADPSIFPQADCTLQNQVCDGAPLPPSDAGPTPDQYEFADVQRCQMQCIETPTCSFFTFSQSSHLCRLLASVNKDAMAEEEGGFCGPVSSVQMCTTPGSSGADSAWDRGVTGKFLYLPTLLKILWQKL